MNAAQTAEAPVNWRLFGLLSAGAALLFVAVRQIPVGTDLNHMDFRASGGNVIEFCDPANPQFIPVVNVRSPVEMKLAVSGAVAGAPAEGLVRLVTANGKPIGPADLAVMHTRRLHLLIIDPSLEDYQHVHPEPTRTSGEWSFRFQPRRSGVYRVFGDFTPIATGRGLYAHADLVVGPASGGAPAGPTAAGEFRTGASVESGDFRFSLEPAAPILAGKPADLHFAIAERNGGPVPLHLVMGAYAHLVAFDQARGGFAHLHPMDPDPEKRPDATNPRLDFRITIPTPGRYVIWAQTLIGDREVFVPFGIVVR